MMGQRVVTALGAQPPRETLLQRLRLSHPRPYGRPGIDRPVLMKDLPFWGRLGAKLVMIPILFGGGWLALRTYAGIYHFLTGLSTAEHNAYHRLIPWDWFRHLVVRDANEKAFAAATLQVLAYNFAARWPRKPPGWWDLYVERWLGVANAKLDYQPLIVLFLAPFWLMVYSLPGEAAFAGYLKLTGHNVAHPPSWQVSVAGILGSFVMGRRVAKGFAFHLQRLMAKERLESREAKGKSLSPAWWMPWAFRKRLEWMRDRHEYGKARVWKHKRAQLWLHATVYAVIVIFVAYATFRGYQLLKTYGI